MFVKNSLIVSYIYCHVQEMNTVQAIFAFRPMTLLHIQLPKKGSGYDRNDK